MTEEEFRAMKEKRQPETAKSPKYRNVKKEWNGLLFDSLKELRRYQDLLAMQQSGQICQLERQKEFELIVNGILTCSYVADFQYLRPRSGVSAFWTDEEKRTGHALIVEDVKSKITRKLPVYVIKKKLMKACLNIEILEK
jgi:hypothetical protein